MLPDPLQSGLEALHRLRDSATWDVALVHVKGLLPAPEAVEIVLQEVAVYGPLPPLSVLDACPRTFKAQAFGFWVKNAVNKKAQTMSITQLRNYTISLDIGCPRHPEQWVLSGKAGCHDKWIPSVATKLAFCYGN
ncbi:hypothetical protein CVT26_011766 [Gymnopilus dilepis]|uniref:Uncharacterized protein n=1 Tax=Gymnopilus dilepis TaxID=231916 RepID=A0A409WWZ7_9AGAR|nr:hypothetical protein CVT26_011766 [Gymnopilus dilepis]